MANLKYKDENGQWHSIVNIRGQQGIQGEKGEIGNSIEYNWEDTSLGVRVEGEEEFQYVNLKGDKGDTGEVTYAQLEGLTGDINSILASLTTLNDLESISERLAVLVDIEEE